MLRTSAIAAREVSGAATRHPAATRVRSGAESHLADLKVKLSITEAQMEGWAAFADALSANSRRMRSVDDDGDHPFGPLQDRLAALASMRHAAARLFTMLSAAQRCSAIQLLPLCCVPQALLGSSGRTSAALIYVN